MDDSWPWILKGLLVGLASGLLGWVHSRARPETDGEDVILTYPSWMRWIMGMLILLMLCALVWGEFVAEGPQSTWLGLMVLIALSIGWIELLTRIWSDAGGVHIWCAIRSNRSIAWNDIDRVYESRGNQWYVLVSKDGTKIRVSDYFLGTKRLFDQVCARAENAEITAEGPRHPITREPLVD